MGREDESEDKKMVVPPANQVLQPPVYHVELQFDAPQLALRKALPNHTATSVVERCESNPISSVLGPFSSFKKKLDAGLHDVLQAAVILPERSDKQQQHQLSQQQKTCGARRS